MILQNAKKFILWTKSLCAKYAFDACIVMGLFVVFYLPPIFTFMGFQFNALHVVGIGSILFLLWKGKILQFLHIRKNIHFVAGFVVLLLHGGLLMLIHKTAISSLAAYLHFLVNVIPFSFVVTHYLKTKNFTLVRFLNLLIFVGMLQAVIAVLTMLIPPLKQVIADMMVDYGYGEVVFGMQHRMYGFSGQLTHAAPILQSFLAVISFYLCFEKSRKYYIPVVLLMGTAIINARASIITFGIGALLVLCCCKRWGKQRVFKTLKVVLYALPVVVLAAVALYFVMPETIGWVWTGIKEIFGFLTGSGQDSVFTTLLSPEWLRLPNGSALFFGVGSTVMQGYADEAAGIAHINSDVGYINDIWYGGIVYAILVYSLFYHMMWQLVKRKDNNLIRFIGIFLMVVMPVVNIKGIAFTMQGYTNFIILFVIVIVNMPWGQRRNMEDGN